MSKKTVRIRVVNMHCQSCESRIGEALGKLPGISQVKADCGAGAVEVEYDPEVTGIKQIESALAAEGYQSRGENSGWAYGLLILLGLFFMLGSAYGNFDLESLLGTRVTYLVLFTIGLFTSLHCTGMCGGLMLSQAIAPEVGGRWSAAFSSMSYHGGRVISYTLIGGVVGAIGSVISFSLPVKAGIMILAGVFMVLMGLNIGGFKVIRGLTLKLPQVVKLPGGRKRSPFVVGFLNGFMPCGPLQTMQLYALGTGSAAVGAGSMLVFALGTVPLMLGFGVLASFLNRGYTRKILRFSGVLVIVLGLVMANRGLALVGVNLTGVDRQASGVAGVSTVAKAEIKDGIQTVMMSANNQGYTPRVLVLQKGTPVRWVISGEKLNSCNNALVVPSLNIQRKLSPGENIIEFTPSASGDISFSCWMGMIRGVIRVVDDLKTAELSGVQPPQSSGGSCCSVDPEGARESIYGDDLSKVPTERLIKKADFSGQSQSARFEGFGDEFTPLYVLVNKDIPATIYFDLKEFTNPSGRYEFFNYETGALLGSFNVRGMSAEYEFTPKETGMYAIVKNRSILGMIEVVDQLEKVDLEEVRKKVF